MLENQAVFAGARLALIAIHDDKGARVGFALEGGPDSIPHVAPFLDRGNSRATHAAEVGIVEFAQQAFRPPAQIRALRPIVRRPPAAHRFDHLGIHRQLTVVVYRRPTELLDLPGPPFEVPGERLRRGIERSVAALDCL